MSAKVFRIVRRVVVFIMICWLGSILWKNHTTPHYETPGSSTSSAHQTSSDPVSAPAK